MYRQAEQEINAWFKNLAEYGTKIFDERAEENVFHDLHNAFASLIGAEAKDIAIGSSFTELLASLAWALVPGEQKNIVTTDVEFPSTIYPWSRVARHTNCEIRMAKSNNYYIAPDEILKLIDEKTDVVCLSQVEYGSGQLYDLKSIAEAAHKHGALFIVDATQSAGAVPLDVNESQVDVVISAAYKWLCGPFGVAAMYIAPHLHNKLDPGVVGFRSHKDMWKFNIKELEYRDDAGRFEFGTMAYGCAHGLTESVNYLVNKGVDNIFAHNLALTEILIEGLKSLDAEIISPENKEERSPIVSAKIPGKDPKDIAKKLGEAGIVISQRNDLVRFSPHLYNSSDDIAKVLEELRRIV
jgi:cysteine desulfurase/selenocysteine lyase